MITDARAIIMPSEISAAGIRHIFEDIMAESTGV